MKNHDNHEISSYTMIYHVILKPSKLLNHLNPILGAELSGQDSLR